MFAVSAGDAPKELQAAILAMKKADNEIRRGVGARMRETMNPVWKSEVSKGLTGWPMEAKMLNVGVRIATGNPPQLRAASSKRKVGSGGGLVPDRHAAGYEFGSGRDNTSVVVSKRGKKFQRHTKRHLPHRVRNGRVVFPAAARVLPRIAAYWVQSVVKVVMDAAEGKD